MISIIKVAVLAYVGYTALLFLMQRRMLFPGGVMAAGRDTSSPVPPGVHRVWLELPAGPVEAWHLPSGQGDKPGPALIFAHGNGELIDDWASLGELTRFGLSVLLIEFPGYGLSAGKTSRRDIGEAYQAGYDWLVERPEVDAERVVAMGRSIGGGVATDLVATRPVRALILQSTFSSLSRMAWEAYRAPGFLIRDPFNNEAVIRSFDGPVLLMHGRRDEVIPFTHARALVRARPDAALIEWDCGHNDCPPSWSEFITDVGDFLVAHGVIERGGGGGT